MILLDFSLLTKLIFVNFAKIFETKNMLSVIFELWLRIFIENHFDVTLNIFISKKLCYWPESNPVAS